MIELILLAVFGVVTAGGIGVIVQKGVTSRKFNSRLGLPAPEPRRMVLGPPQQLMLEAPVRDLPPEIRREIDQDPEWWDEQFHKTLETSGSREVLAIRGSYTYDGDDLPDHAVLRDCTCADCSV